jgi:hypothetical protein
VILSFLLLGVAVGIANADSVWNFDNSSASGTPFSETSNGVTATFSATPGSPFYGVYPGLSQFEIEPVTGLFSSLTGNALGNFYDGRWILTVDFAEATSISLLFATVQSGDDTHPNAGVFTLSAFEHGTPVGTVSATGTVAQGFNHPGADHPEGSIGLAGVLFDEVKMSSNTDSFVVDDIHLTRAVEVVGIPEPTSLLLLSCGLVVVAAMRRRKLARGH